MIGGNGYVSSRQGGSWMPACTRHPCPVDEWCGRRRCRRGSECVCVREKAVAWNGPLLDRCVRVECLWPGSVDLCA